MIDLIGTVPIQAAVVGAVLLAALLIVAAAASYYLVVGSSRAGTTESRPDFMIDITFEIVDDVASQQYPDADRVVARKQRRRGTGATGAGRGPGFNRKLALADGESEGELELGPGQWVYAVVADGETIGTRTHRVDPELHSDRVVLSVDPYTADVAVTYAPTCDPIEGVTVEATADVDYWDDKKQTDTDGTVTFEVPRSATEVQFDAEHPGGSPVESTSQVEQAAQNGVELTVADETGSVRVATVGGDIAWPEVDVRVAPDSRRIQTYAGEATITTDSQGRRTVERLPFFIKILDGGPYVRVNSDKLPNNLRSIRWGIRHKRPGCRHNSVRCDRIHI